MITINGTGIIVLLAVGYLGVNSIVKGTPVVAKKVINKLRTTLNERKNKD